MIPALLFTVLAALLGLVAWIWLIVIAFRAGKTGWGIGLIIAIFIPFGPIAALVFALIHSEDTRRPRHMLFASLGLGLIAGFLLTRAANSALKEAPGLLGDPDLQVVTTPTDSRPESMPADEPPAPQAAARSRPAPPPSGPGDRPRRRPTAPLSTPPPAQVPTPDPTAITTDPSATSAAARPDISPVEVLWTRLSEPLPNQLRNVDVRISNSATQAVTELKLGLDYLDAKGQRLGGRSTVHSGDGPLGRAGATNEFRMTAFQVPEFTTSLRVTVEAVVFEDHSRWPSGR